jgi:nucleotide-binding universal stress UspA family protein
MFFRRILVPLDGTRFGERALPYAESLARSANGTLILVRAVTAGRLERADLADALTVADEYLDHVATRLRARGIDVESGAPYGPIAGWILEEIELRRADVVVMATHGRAGIDRLVHGSVAEAVLAKAPVPLLLIHAAASLVSIEPPRLVVPLDGSPFAEEALPEAADLAHKLGGEIVLVQALAWPEHALTGTDGRVAAYIDEQVASARADATRYLESVRAWLLAQRPGLTVTCEVRFGPADEVIASSSTGHAGLVVMATHGRTGVPRLVKGSVAARTLRRGTCLLLVGPGQERARKSSVGYAA